MAEDIEVTQVKNWRSIVTLIGFVFTNLGVLFPFHIPVYVPRRASDAVLDALSAFRVISPMDDRSQHGSSNDWGGKARHFIRLNFPVNYVTGPLIVNIFLLASSAIGQKEVHDGIIGTNRISPIDIMLFFLSLTYIAISLDASGLFRWIIFRVLQQGGVVGHKLFLYLYAFFFGLASFIGNNLVILSSTASVVYLTRISSNIIHPRAWIHTQFAAANIGSAILATSNPTNLVLVSAFNIKFFHYTANMIVPVIATAIFLSPVLLYVIFANEALIPLKMEIYEIPKEAKAKRPINPNIPYARGVAGDDPDTIQKIPILSAEEIINPFLDKASALFGALIMAASLTTLLALNTATAISEEHPVFWVVLPAALILFSWDVSQGWFHRNETREIAYQGRLEIERFRAEQEIRQREELRPASEQENENPTAITVIQNSIPTQISDDDPGQPRSGRLTLVSLLQVGYTWAQETFPAATAVLALLPVSLIPFTFCMFVLIQALVTKGWILVFAHGWENWVNKTGTMGAIGGMGFLSVILCNFSGTNIGATILLCRLIQTWEQIHQINGSPISDREFWGTVYSMALGVNYGAFSASMSASPAGLLWRDILASRLIRVGRIEFARVNVPIISIAMAVGGAVLVGEVYIMRSDSPY